VVLDRLDYESSEEASVPPSEKVLIAPEFVLADARPIAHAMGQKDLL
jgi:hypothetical protein